MLSKIKTCSITGLSAWDIEVEVDIQNGLPAVNIVGLADTAVKESKERVRAAIHNSGYRFPMKRITVNLAPADTKKEGTHFDVPIALGILKASRQIKQDAYSDTIILGELSLDGNIHKINGVLPMLLEMYHKGFRKVILPEANLEESKLVKEMKSIGVKNLKELASVCNGTAEPVVHIGGVSGFLKDENIEEDFQELAGQENLKRAMEITAAGSHNLLIVGPPGSGKTMAARRLPSILPKLTFDEALEITKIYSVSGLLEPNQGLVTRRPFRAPHHTSSMIALTGGGRIPKPGEVSFSHYGVLFLDELPEFSKKTIEVLRQPLEDGFISISRVHGSFTYPAKFTLVCSMNPCPCGFYGTDNSEKCTCTSQQISNYAGKISGPLLDRIDLIVETTAISYIDLTNSKKAESSREIRKRVEKARQKQLNRYEGTKIIFNSQLTPSAVKKYCNLDAASKKLMNTAFDKMKLSARGYNRILKVARTIADLEDCEKITSGHLSEALQYRSNYSIKR